MAPIVELHQSCGFCSAQPGCGVASGWLCDAAPLMRPFSSTSVALTALVPTSIPRKTLKGRLRGRKLSSSGSVREGRIRPRRRRTYHRRADEATDEPTDEATAEATGEASGQA